MRVPLPRNRLVQLTLVGALLTTAVAAGLLVPGAFDNSPDSGSSTTTLGPDAPTPNDQFTPATSGGDDDHVEYEDEHEEDEDDDEDEHEYEEYENRDAVDSPRATGGAYP